MYSILKIGGKANLSYKYYICDSISDRDQIPENIEYGSKAYCIDEQETYIKDLNSWTKFNTGNSGGTGAIEDVKVDGISVVLEGIANIDLSGKANASDVYTKVQLDALLNNKEDKISAYTESEIDDLVEGGWNA